MIDLIQFIVNPGDSVSFSLKMNETQQAGLRTGYYVTSVLFDSLWPYGPWPTRLLCPWGFSRQEYWSWLPFPPPGDLPNSGIEHASPVVPTLAGGFFTTEPPGRCHQAPHLSHWAQRLFLGPAHTACQLSHWLRVGRTTETSFSLLQNTQNLKVKQEFETKVYPEKLKAWKSP